MFVMHVGEILWVYLIVCSTWTQRWGPWAPRKALYQRLGWTSDALSDQNTAGQGCRRSKWFLKDRKERERKIKWSQPFTSIHTSFISCNSFTLTVHVYGLTCFRVCCNKYIIWPGLEVLNVLPVVCEIVSHWDSMEIKQFWSRGFLHV